MDVYYQLQRQRFVWDGDKAASNLTRHGISFETAAEALVDPFVAFLVADGPEGARQVAIGQTFDETLLYVVNIEREDLSVRIISAWRATAREKRLYEDRE